MTTLPQDHVRALHALLPGIAASCVETIVREVPDYQRAFDPKLSRNIERAVQQALAAFVDSLDADDTTNAVADMAHGAFRLGQGEATSGRSTDALISAYRVGARVSWDNVSSFFVEKNYNADVVAQLASKTFAYIDQLSAASIAGHNEALTARTAEIGRRRDQLAAALASGESHSALTSLAETAHWTPPATLTAIVLDGTPSRHLVTMTDERTLWTAAGADTTIGLIPNLPDHRRAAVLQAVGDVQASLGPTTEWTQAAESIRRAQRAKALELGRSDVLQLLPQLALSADSFVADLLRQRALEPLADLTPGKQKLQAETLHSWLLHLGRRDDVAEHLHVHPQTVRYRMSSIRDAYGERLKDPQAVLELILGLSIALSDGELGKDDDE